MGQLLDLTTFARQIESQVGKPPANVAPVTLVGDKVYAIPWYIMGAFWYVWRDVFEKNKVKLPGTFEDAKQAARALNRPNENFYGMGQSWNRTTDGYGVMQSLMYSYGVGWASKDGKYRSIKTPTMQQVMQWATDIYKEGIQPADTLTWTGSGNNENFMLRISPRPPTDPASPSRLRTRWPRRRMPRRGSRGKRRSPITWRCRTLRGRTDGGCGQSP